MKKLLFIATNRGRAYVMYSKSEILQIAVLDYFLISTFTKHVFSFLSAWRNFKTLGVHIHIHYYVHQILKMNDELFFIFNVLCSWSYDLESSDLEHLFLGTRLDGCLWILLYFLEIIYNRAFFFSTFEWERPLIEKLRFKHLDEAFQMFLFFRILKIHGLDYVRMNFFIV